MIRFKCVGDTQVEEAFVCKKVYTLQDNKRVMYKELQNMLSERKYGFIRIIDKKEETICYAYLDEYPEYEEIDTLLDEFTAAKAHIFIHEVYPEVKIVHVHGMNEWALRFVHILDEYGIPVYVSGNLWNVMSTAKTDHNVTEYKDTEILHIYAEGHELNCTDEHRDIMEAWNVLLEIGKLNSIWVTEKFKERCMREKVLTAYFPALLQPKSMEEDYRQKLHLNPCHDNFAWKKNFLVDQICKVNGYKITKEQWFKEQTKRQRADMTIDDITFRSKIYGSADNKVYLIGPGIVDAKYVMNDGEGFAYCLYRQLCQAGSPYSVVSISVNSQDYFYYEKILSYIELGQKDLVFLIAESQEKGKQIFHYQSDIAVETIFEKRVTDWYYDKPLHTNFEGNKQLAKAIVQQCMLTKLNFLQLEIRAIDEKRGKSVKKEQVI